MEQKELRRYTANAITTARSEEVADALISAETTLTDLP